jgi:hypothetical protein
MTSPTPDGKHKPHVNVGVIGGNQGLSPDAFAAAAAMVSDAIKAYEDEQPLHVYEWLDQPSTDEGEILAKEWLEQFVRPAEAKDLTWLKRHRLTCEYEGKRYRCIGASCMGDVWLTSKMTNPDGYEKRVEVESLSNWEREEVTSQPRSSGKVGSFLAATALLGAAGWGMPCFGRRESSSDVRHDPERPKTAKDLEAMEAARLKRERKEAKKRKP